MGMYDTYDDFLAGLGLHNNSSGMWNSYTWTVQQQPDDYRTIDAQAAFDYGRIVASRQQQFNAWRQAQQAQYDAYQSQVAAIRNAQLAAALWHSAASTEIKHVVPRRRFRGRVRRIVRRAWRVLVHWRGHEFGFDPACPMCHVH